MFRTRVVWLLWMSSLCTSPATAVEWDDVFSPRELPWINREAGEAAEREEEPLETDRDSFTPSTITVDRGKTIFETSYTYIDSRLADDTHSFPEIITRYGLTKRLELRLGWNYEIGSGGSVSNGDPGEFEGLGGEQESQLLYGFKYLLTDQRSWLPQSAMIVQGTTPTSGPETATDFQLGYVFGWTILDDWKLDSAIRYLKTTGEKDSFNIWAPSVVLKVPVQERWNIHAEYFGQFTDGKAEGRNPQYFSPGIHYLVTNNCEVGLRVGWGLNQSADIFFSNVGLGWRF